MRSDPCTKAFGGRLVAAAVAVALAAVPARAQLSSFDRVDVHEENGLFTVNAEFVIDRPLSVAFQVLTDYDNISRFMPGVRKSVVHERGPAGAVVEQEAVSRLLLFSKRVHLVLEIEERPDIIVFRDRCGRSFTRYEGVWRLVPRGDHVAVAYELQADPAFDVPAFILEGLLRRDSRRLIDALRHEVVARPRASVEG